MEYINNGRMNGRVRASGRPCSFWANLDRERVYELSRLVDAQLVPPKVHRNPPYWPLISTPKAEPTFVPFICRASCLQHVPGH